MSAAQTERAFTPPQFFCECDDLDRLDLLCSHQLDELVKPCTRLALLFTLCLVPVTGRFFTALRLFVKD
ncbi:MAG: hypothetical protein WA988_02165 [Candidatus Nanopelagicales bacterium]